jgi:hypothetical protein
MKPPALPVPFASFPLVGRKVTGAESMVKKNERRGYAKFIKS